MTRKQILIRSGTAVERTERLVARARATIHPTMDETSHTPLVTPTPEPAIDNA